MSTSYEPQTIEPKWQQRWLRAGIYHSERDEERQKFYCLEMYPYPSGNLHMGHVRVYSLGDAIARFKRMNGANLLHPMGWDAFGLPAENAAIERGVHPAAWTRSNIETMKGQLQRLGVSYDWRREVATYRPDYYRWNQWIFQLMYRRGLAYKKEAQVNWCPSCATVLANEQVVDGRCWRCDSEVGERQLSQWFLRITAYADRLLEDLDGLDGWPERVKVMQRNWIGRSVGARVTFPVDGEEAALEVFTTRPDTLCGATFMAVAPEHPVVERLIAGRPEAGAVREFVARATAQTAAERMTHGKEGVRTGRHCINPLTGDRIPIFVADYVLLEYGTGAIMAVPAHDERDYAFAQEKGLEIKRVIVNPDGDEMLPYVGDGPMTASGDFDGLAGEEARRAVIAYLEEEGLGGAEVNYRLRDWGISRQRYWGTPIPIIYCDTCGVVPVPEKDLPVVLPEDADFATGGPSPLERSEAFVRCACPQCGADARRETDTMDTFVDSSWYFLRYASPQLETAPFDPAAANYWLPVDQYVGGIEHAVLHLLYSRFFMKVLHDEGLVRAEEPFQNYLANGMVLKDGAAMSKSRGNVVSPDDIVARYGADTARLFILFAAPPEDDLAWSDSGVEGCSRFLHRVWRLVTDEAERLAGVDGAAARAAASSLSGRERQLRRKVHETVRRVNDDVGRRLKLNTAISAIMELVNEVEAYRREVPAAEQDERVLREAVDHLLLLLAPFAPHLAEELWHRLDQEESVHVQSWPALDEEALKRDVTEVVIQVNGRVRDRVMAPVGAGEDELKELALGRERIQQFVDRGQLVRVITVPDRLVNLVVTNGR